MREDLRVRETVLIAEDDDGLVPAGVDAPVVRISFAASPRLGDRVGRLREAGQQMVGDRAAAVLTNIDEGTNLFMGECRCRILGKNSPDNVGKTLFQFSLGRFSFCHIITKLR